MSADSRHLSHRPTAETSRREFLRSAVAGGAALAGASSLIAPSPATASPAPRAEPLPTVTIAGVTIPRMIVGCNPIGGWSHMCRNMTLAMTDYFTLERTVGFIQDCEKAGLDVWLTYWDKKPLDALKQLWAKGSRVRPYFLGNLEANGTLSKDILEYKPIWYVHHGGVTDSLFASGKQEQVHDFVKKVHDVLGIPAGISAHNPECIKYAEDHGWEADFYQCCLYYVTRPHEEIRAKLGAAPLGESFLDTDRDTMLNVIRQVKKPCLAFKILGAGRLCETDYDVEEAFQYALGRIKKTDAIIVGMWPKFKDEITQNVGFLRKYGKIA
jgi:hypothetical protein